mmetsp:Transcript_43194/g.105684  ORF Transcript_43194/g.105684 Transcript_43194/m.105684 type:complete len:254 (+) Transcript_43194:1341-2102(+)
MMVLKGVRQMGHSGASREHQRHAFSMMHGAQNCACSHGMSLHAAALSRHTQHRPSPSSAPSLASLASLSLRSRTSRVLSHLSAAKRSWPGRTPWPGFEYPTQSSPSSAVEMMLRACCARSLGVILGAARARPAEEVLSKGDVPERPCSMSPSKGAGMCPKPRWPLYRLYPTRTHPRQHTHPQMPTLVAAKIETMLVVPHSFRSCMQVHMKLARFSRTSPLAFFTYHRSSGGSVGGLASVAFGSGARLPAWADE